MYIEIAYPVFFSILLHRPSYLLERLCGEVCVGVGGLGARSSSSSVSEEEGEERKLKERTHCSLSLFSRLLIVSRSLSFSSGDLGYSSISYFRSLSHHHIAHSSSYYTLDFSLFSAL